MKLLVTGGCGFIGSHFVEAAIAAGHRILNLDKLTYAAHPGSLRHLAGHPLYEFRQVDITDSDAVTRAFIDFLPEAVLHLAAETHVDRSIDDPAPFLQTNVTGTFTLLKGAHEFWSRPRSEIRSPRFLQLSTDEVFGSLGAEDPPFTESSPYAPRSPYAASKAAADHLVRAWSTTYGLPVLIIHACNIYGPRQFPEKLIPLSILKALRGESIPIYGDGTQVRDWLYVQDLTKGILRVLEQGKPGQSYNLAAGRPSTNLDLVHRLLSVLDEFTETPKHRKTETPYHHVSDRPGHDLRYQMDASKAAQDLGWQPATTLENGLRATVRWYLDHETWWRPLLEEQSPLSRVGIFPTRQSIPGQA